MDYIDKAFYKIGIWTFLALGTVFLVIYFAGPAWQRLVPPCALYTMTGYYCPGCGGTRAVAQLLRGNLLRSFFYHPLVLYGTAIYLWFMVSNTVQAVSKDKCKIGMHYKNIYVIIGLVLLGLNFIIKNIMIYFGVPL